MPTLVYQVGDHHPGKPPGAVVEVLADDVPAGPTAERVFGRVVVPDRSVEELRAIYLRDGTPQELLDARDAAHADWQAAVAAATKKHADLKGDALDDAVAGDPDVLAARAAGHAAVEAIHAAGPVAPRAVLLDLAKLPVKHVDAVRANRAARAAVQALAKDAAKLAVHTVVEDRLGRVLTTDERDVKTIELMEDVRKVSKAAPDVAALGDSQFVAGFAGARELAEAEEIPAARKTLAEALLATGPARAVREEIAAASKLGRDAVEEAALESIEIPKPFDVAGDDLAALHAVGP